MAAVERPKRDITSGVALPQCSNTWSRQLFWCMEPCPMMFSSPSSQGHLLFSIPIGLRGRKEVNKVGGGRGNLYSGTVGSAPSPLFLKEQTGIESFAIGKSLGAKAMNWKIKDPRSGKEYHFAEGTEVTVLEVFAGKRTRTKLAPKVARGLSRQHGGKPSSWSHVKGIGTIDLGDRWKEAEVHWFERPGGTRVGFKIKRWRE